MNPFEANFFCCAFLKKCFQKIRRCSRKNISFTGMAKMAVLSAFKKNLITINPVYKVCMCPFLKLKKAEVMIILSYSVTKLQFNNLRYNYNKLVTRVQIKVLTKTTFFHILILATLCKSFSRYFFCLYSYLCLKDILSQGAKHKYWAWAVDFLNK